MHHLAAVAAGAYPARRPPNARAAGAAGPVLVACRQWDPHGLARRLPSRGVDVWRGAPLLPRRVQCPGCVCSALAAGSGGSGPVLVFVSSPFPPSCPAFPALCVAGRFARVFPTLARWYAILCGLRIPLARSGRPSCNSACPLRVRALALSRRPRPPPLPGSMWRVHLARSRCWAPVGPFHAVRAPYACRASVPCSVRLAWGGGGPVLFPPCLAWGCVPPFGAPHSARSCELALRAVGPARGRPGGGGCYLCAASGVERCTIPDRSFSGGAAGAHFPLAMGAGGAGVGTRHRPHSARCCKRTLRAVEAARGRPGWTPLAPA